MSPETVTPVKRRAADGVVYERTGEKRTPEVGELHWCDATRPAPYPFEWPVATHWEPKEDWPPREWQCSDPDGRFPSQPEDQHQRPSNYLHPSNRPCISCGTPVATHKQRDILGALFCPQVHKCPIWKVSEDQNWQPPDPAAAPGNPLDSLFEKLKTTAGDVESIPVLAMLHQAKALERIADALEVIQNRGGSTPLQTQSVGSGGTVCRMCQLDEHARCLNPLLNSISQADGHHVVGLCQCETCNARPGMPAKGNLHVHRFEGMEDNHYCTQCGGGRLHPIHQA